MQHNHHATTEATIADHTMCRHRCLHFTCHIGNSIQPRHTASHPIRRGLQLVSDSSGCTLHILSRSNVGEKAWEV